MTRKLDAATEAHVKKVLASDEFRQIREQARSAVLDHAIKSLETHRDARRALAEARAALAPAPAPESYPYNGGGNFLQREREEASRAAPAPAPESADHGPYKDRFGKDIETKW